MEIRLFIKKQKLTDYLLSEKDRSIMIENSSLPCSFMLPRRCEDDMCSIILTFNISDLGTYDYVDDCGNDLRCHVIRAGGKWGVLYVVDDSSLVLDYTPWLQASKYSVKVENVRKWKNGLFAYVDVVTADGSKLTVIANDYFLKPDRYVEGNSLTLNIFAIAPNGLDKVDNPLFKEGNKALWDDIRKNFYDSGENMPKGFFKSQLVISELVKDEQVPAVYKLLSRMMGQKLVRHMDIEMKVCRLEIPMLGDETLKVYVPLDAAKGRKGCHSEAVMTLYAYL